MANTVSFGTLIDPDEEQIQRQRRLADALRAQSSQQEPMQTAGGMVVPVSPFQGLAKLAQAFSASKLEKDADAKQRDILARRSQIAANDMTALVGALRGSPSIPEVQGNNPSAYTPAQEAQAPDLNRALSIALRSENPAVQGVGVNMIQPLIQKQLEMDQIQRALGGGQGSAGGAPSGGMPSVAGVDPRALALTAMGGTGAKIGEMIQSAQKPIALREGDLVRPDANGQYSSVYTQPKLEAGMEPVRDPQGRVIGSRAIPGYAAGASDISGAKEGAKARLDLTTVDTPDGPRMMTRAQAAALAGGQIPAAQQGIEPGTFRGDPSTIMAQIAAIRDPQERANALDSYRKQVAAPGIALQDDASKKFGQQIATNSAEALLAGRDKAKTASDDLMAVNEARKAVASGAFQGSGADAKLAIAKFINANVPGLTVNPEKVANTDYLKSTLGSGLLAQAKSLGANPSNADAERINEIVGSIGKDPGAMQKILDWRETMNRRAIANHNGTVEDAERRGMKSPYDLRIQPPQITPPQNAGQKTVVRTGMANGRRVVQYSDGTIDYAN